MLKQTAARTQPSFCRRFKGQISMKIKKELTEYYLLNFKHCIDHYVSKVTETALASRV